MNLPIPKKDKDAKKAKEVSPRISTGSAQPKQKKRRSSAEKLQVTSAKTTPSDFQVTDDSVDEVEIESDRESNLGEKTDEHLLEFQGDDDDDDLASSVNSSVSSKSEESKRSSAKRKAKAEPLPNPSSIKTIVQEQVVPEFHLKDLDYSNIKRLQSYVELKKSLNQRFNLGKLIRPDVNQTITEYFVEYGVADASNWLNWSHELLFEHLINLSGGEANVTSIQEKLDNAKAKVLKAAKALVYHPLKPKSTLAFSQMLIEIPRVCETDKMSDAENKALVEIALKNLGMETDARFKDAINEIRAELTSFKSRIQNLDQPVSHRIQTHCSGFK